MGTPHSRHRVQVPSIRKGRRRRASPFLFPSQRRDSHPRSFLQAVSFLHTQHIAHLSLSPATVAYLPTLDRWSLASFESSIQGDPLAKRPTLVTGAASETPKGYSAPELSDDVAYDPFAVDLWCLGKILQGAAAVRPALLSACRTPASRADPFPSH